MSRTFRLAVAVLALLALDCAKGVSVRIPGGGFSLAVLRRDGVAIPFAHFDGRRWNNPWPVAGKDFDVPLQLSDVPRDWWPGGRPIASWTAWPLEGDSTVVESRAPVTVVAECQRGLGISTSYKPAGPVAPETVQPYPKDGLATAGKVVVERPEILQASAPGWKAVQDAVQREVTDLEDRAVRALGEGSWVSPGWLHPSSPAEREATPFTPELIVSVTPRAFYFEGVKTYRPPTAFVGGEGGGQVPNRCNLLTYAAGWVLLSEEGKPRVQASADVTDCNREGMVYTLPLGMVRRGKTAFFAVQVSGWGYERYEVLEVRGDLVESAIAVPGGWCGG